MKKTPDLKQAETPAMKALRKQKIESRMEEIPKKYRKIYKKAVETHSKTAAIKAFCLECVCWQKKEIINCSCLACPLFGVRPFTESRQPSKNEGFCDQTSTNMSPAIAKEGQTKKQACFEHKTAKTANLKNGGK